MISEISSQSTMQTEPYSRPPSVIQIMEITDASETNPQPISEDEKAIGNFITSDILKYFGGVSNLLDLKELKLKVDTTDTSLGSIGLLVPHLMKLNLNNSHITSVRDIGTHFENLTTISLARCCLEDLDGISCIETIQDLYLAYNRISDLSPLSMLEELKVLDLEGNNIDDIVQVEYLCLCSQLSILTLRGNPIEQMPSRREINGQQNSYNYKETVLSCLPTLCMLDDEAFLVDLINGDLVKRVKPVHTTEGYRKDELILQNRLKANQITESPSEFSTTAKQPISDRERKDNKSTTSQLNAVDSCSSLTHGCLMYGSPIRALRHRVARVNESKCFKSPSLKFIAEHSYLPVDEDGAEKDDIFKELREWRVKNRSLFGGKEEQVESVLATPPKLKYVTSRKHCKLLPSDHGMVPRPSTVCDFRARKYAALSPVKYEDAIERRESVRSKSIGKPDPKLTLEDAQLTAKDAELTSENVKLMSGNVKLTSYRPSTARAALQSTQRSFRINR